MARTQAADYDEKREIITREAAFLFAEKGFAGASIADLAARCKVSKSLIYHYYAAKEDILFAVMNQHVDDLLGVVADVLASAAAPAETLRALSKALLRAYVGAAGYQKVLLYELGSLPDDKRGIIVAKQREIIAGVERLLAEIDPALARDKARLRARVMLYFGMLNWTDTWHRPRGPISRDEIALTAAALLLGENG